MINCPILFLHIVPYKNLSGWGGGVGGVPFVFIYSQNARVAVFSEIKVYLQGKAYLQLVKALKKGLKNIA